MCTQLKDSHNISQTDIYTKISLTFIDRFENKNNHSKKRYHSDQRGDALSGLFRANKQIMKYSPATLLLIISIIYYIKRRWNNGKAIRCGRLFVPSQFLFYDTIQHPSRCTFWRFIFFCLNSLTAHLHVWFSYLMTNKKWHAGKQNKIFHIFY